MSDNEAPVFDCTTLADITANNDAGRCYATVSVTAPQASDNCSGTVTATGVRDDNELLTAVYPVGTTTITWTFTDAAGKEKNARRKW
ncbi:MAG: HYR domain-containing protein [Haliscomenobacter sp.]|nr:HYR domain-containing protein [Haliscomenobacter sp.]